MVASAVTTSLPAVAGFSPTSSLPRHLINPIANDSPSHIQVTWSYPQQHFNIPFGLTHHERNERRNLSGAPKRILLTNGRFPVTINLARQLKRAGNTVYCVDLMEYHICKLSNAVKKSYYVDAPHVKPQGYIDGVKKAIREQNIDMLIPLHEEIFYLAKSGEPETLDRLFAPDFKVLLRLHNKWEFSKWLKKAGLDCPGTWLCKSKEYVLALKPVFGRAKSGVSREKATIPVTRGLG